MGSLGSSHRSRFTPEESRAYADRAADIRMRAHSVEEGAWYEWYLEALESDGLPSVEASPAAPARAASADGHRPCSIGHKWPSASRFTVEQAGSVIQLRVAGVGSGGRPGKKKPIECWSLKSRKECWRIVSALPWDEFQASVMIVLTYPGREGVQFIPSSGRACQRHLRLFLRRWERRYGPVRGVWKREFQRREGEWEHEYQRCAPHFHIWLGLDQVGMAEGELQEMRDFADSAWAEIVGAPARTAVKVGSAKWAVAYGKGYLQKDSKKEYQNQVPVGFEQPGRFWGRIGDFSPRWTVEQVPGRVFVQLRRLIARYYRARCFLRADSKARARVKVAGGLCGLFAVSQAGFPHQLMAAAESMVLEQARLTRVPEESMAEGTRRELGRGVLW